MPKPCATREFWWFWLAVHYHADPQVHHGLPDFIASLGAAVISEDAMPAAETGHRMSFPLRARNQWTYAARLYRAGLWACEADHGNARVELVQLTSFGCGIDAITADQMRELHCAPTASSIPSSRWTRAMPRLCTYSYPLAAGGEPQQAGNSTATAVSTCRRYSAALMQPRIPFLCRKWPRCIFRS